MLNIKQGWLFLMNVFKRYDKYQEVDLFYDIKTDDFFVGDGFYTRGKQKKHQIHLGCWSNRASYDRFVLFLKEIKLRYSLFEVSELTKKAKEFVCNGAGSKGLGWVVPDFKFGNAADIHDLMYTIGGDSKDKKWADLVFLWNMQRDGANWLAYIYFWAVKFMGKNAFEFRYKKLTIEEINGALSGK